MTMYKIPIIVFALFISVWPSFAGRLLVKSADAHEKVILTTDRSLYICGEKLQFFASLSVGKDVNTPALSQVLYCELISPDGNKMAGGKFMIDASAANGCIDIPANLLTGTYYLRAYTKLMRNYGFGSYGYKQVRIVNPRKDDVLAAVNNQNVGILQFEQTTSDGIKDLLSVTLDKTNCTPRENITLLLQSAIAEDNSIKNVSISVIPENVGPAQKSIKQEKKTTAEKQDYYPETRGLSVSGKLTIAGTEKPLADKKVNLSIIGEGRDFMAARTDSLGRFFFALPSYSGYRDLFICAEKMDSLKVKIWVDNDFCTLPVYLPSPVFSLTQPERETVRNMAVNEQINSLFYSDSTQQAKSISRDRPVFYGRPTAIIYIDQYIQLPTLEEYFNELPSEVKVRTRKGQKSFAVLGSRGVSFYDPLVMIDWVAIDEPSRILAVSPQKISRIEVVNEDYVKGGQTYGGIISIISKKGDFAGIDLPSAGIFINYQFLPEDDCTPVMVDNVSEHPDTRNTILWKPGVIIPNGKSEKFVFTSPDTPGKYNVVLEGITSKGEAFTTSVPFVVGK